VTPSFLRPLLVLLLLAPLRLHAQPSAPDPARVLDEEMSAAEVALRAGEVQLAESRYRGALLEGWLLLGALDAAAGRLPEARASLERAAVSATETRRALQSLALVALQSGDASEAVTLLTRVLAGAPQDLATRRLLAQALVAGGKPQEAVQELEEAHAAAPRDLELTFTLASGYLRVQKDDAAARLFAEVVKGRPIPQTHVLIGRTYRDFGHYDAARAALRAALKQDPTVRRAHYYLGMIAVLENGTAGLDEAIREFQAEIRLAPRDPLASLRLGMALVEAQRQAEALPLLERAARSQPPPADAFHYLGRALLSLDRPPEAEAALRRALELTQGPGADEVRLEGIHYLLGQALRRLGRAEEAVTHFGHAERVSTDRARSSREYLERYLADLPNTGSVVAALPAVLEGSPVAGVPEQGRQDLRRRATAALARAYLNLGVMHAQAQRFARAAEELEKAAAVDPGFPQVQYSLGVAYFNTQRFDVAAAALARARAQAPEDPGLRRMLALALFNSEAYGEAADLLRDDPSRTADPSLQYAYGVALVRSGRAAEAQRIFSEMLSRHAGSAELNVVLGQAHAQEGDYDAAVTTLQHALQLDPQVAEANATLGIIHLKRGELPQAERALRAELRAHPGDLQSQHHLATVLELEGRAEEAVPLLRSVLKARPEFGDARYLLGKILLAQGAAAEAVEHLEAAARLDPEAPNVRYQLGQAYQKVGRADRAQAEFELFQRLKDKRRGGTP